ncbi:6,7-dimethyl-8-ribityllumazine synthase [Companilactobacillus halodurans]|uniref:6,7-dimethyl-8-ribityllumazine synthase n=1 Tax=Companilactobacillus halodurans TaxID=2584183 RepID=A0A5P0ZL69_9LACO|nr:6,7-dimethyl-8-ribityllumazine synthase [Companilactobacillus halodurans]MQS74859.1 6,7-dimethyl-8-ribityllumazine synthase [Companilactobacillus halodurans]MQS97254.1 6,7-dimethyl-8-ribityllumazine synthase [Companilactobacillus halodurans]
MRPVIGEIKGQGLKIAIVVSRFNQIVTDRLIDGAVAKLEQSGVNASDIKTFQVPGAMEIPRIARLISQQRNYDGIITLGAVVKGQTAHFDYVCAQSASGIAQTSLNGKVPLTYGVLTTENMAQALDRAGGKAGNKGSECAEDILEMINLEIKLE